MILELSKMKGDERLQWPHTDIRISLDSPATSVLVDFRRNRPLVIESSLDAYRAQQFMQKAHVSFKMVIDEDKHLLGVLSLDDFERIDFRQRVSSVYRRDALVVAEVMQPLDTLHALPLEQVKNSSIADLLNALSLYEKHHCLVTEEEGTTIVGYFSSVDIGNEIMPEKFVGESPVFSRLYREE